MNRQQLKITKSTEKRLDVLIADQFPDFSRSYIKKMIDGGYVFVNAKIAKVSRKCQAGDIIEIDFPETKELDTKPQNIQLDIIYQDEDIAVINKPKGMAVHPSAGNTENTLVNALLYHIKDLSGINGVLRPGIVHRLDKDTSGLLVIAKNDAAHKNLAEQIKQKTAFREYTALTSGNIKQDSATICAPIGRHKTDRLKNAVVKNGKEAVTHISVLKRYEGYTLISCRLETGRTHQIRVHMKHFGNPIVGDKIYGTKKIELSKNGQLLHATRLGLKHPKTNEEMLFYAPLPQDFANILSKLKEKD